MTMTDPLVTGLSHLKTRMANRPAKEPWRMPRWDDLAREQYLIAVDPSLGAAGVVVLSTAVGRLAIVEARTFRSGVPLNTGHEGNMRRTIMLRREFRSYLASFSSAVDPVQLVHEGPPVGGGKIRNPESTLLAGVALRMAVNDLSGFTLLPMVQRRQHARFLCGDAAASKKEHHTAMFEALRFMPVINLELITNEATRDALSIGLLTLHRLGEESTV